MVQSLGPESSCRAIPYLSRAFPLAQCLRLAACQLPRQEALTHPRLPTGDLSSFTNGQPCYLMEEGRRLAWGCWCPDQLGRTDARLTTACRHFAMVSVDQILERQRQYFDFTVRTVKDDHPGK